MTSGQSNLTEDRIAAADRRFNRMCTRVWAHWNLCFFRLTRVHNPNDKSIGSAVSAQLTAESPYTFQWSTLSHRIFPSHGGSGPHLIHDLFGPVQAHSPNGVSASRWVQLLSHRWPQSIPILYSWPPLPPPQKIATFPWGDLDPCLIRGSLGPPESSIQTASRSAESFLQGSLVWQTDIPRYSVGNNRPRLYVRT